MSQLRTVKITSATGATILFALLITVYGANCDCTLNKNEDTITRTDLRGYANDDDIFDFGDSRIDTMIRPSRRPFTPLGGAFVRNKAILDPIARRFVSIVDTLKLPVDFNQVGNPIANWLDRDHGFRSNPIRIDDTRVKEYIEKSLMYYLYILRHIHQDFRLHLGETASNDKWQRNAKNYIIKALRETMQWYLENYGEKWNQLFHVYIMNVRTIVDKEFGLKTTKYPVNPPPDPFETGMLMYSARKPFKKLGK